MLFKGRVVLSKLKEPFSGLSHLAGAVFSIPVTVALAVYAYTNSSSVAAFIVFGIALLLLYSASALYHLLPVSDKISAVLRRVDHTMIFVLIAGTYTPVALGPLRGGWGYALFAVIWGIAAAGILMKIFWISAPRWLSTSIYVLMGWTALFFFVPLIRAVSVTALLLVVLGGVLYTLGAVIYGTKWPKINLKQFGYHELFHIFVLAGSTVHIIFMFLII
jgi:hemolysin III